MENKNNWGEIGKGRRSGVLVPLFSVYSRNSAGIGNLEDLKLLTDWCEKTGNSILQLLPMNEVGDSFCPYESVSSFALEPMYAAVKRDNSPSPQAPPFQNFGKGTRPPQRGGKSGGRVDYRVKEEKIKVLREIFFESRNRDRNEVEKFREENAWWLDDFGLFKVLKAHHENKPWHEWPAAYQNRDAESIKLFCSEHKTEIGFQIWIQWLLYKQFKNARAYASGKGILLMGDLPVLSSRDSADVWAHPEFFKLDFAAGAPPDMFSRKGQRWGMPTYNWKRIAGDNYRYLKEKLRYAGEFYDILRIDHVVGLFRIWSIPFQDPPENEGANGSFDPPDEREWEAHGRKILSVMLESTKMLLCGEDLGIIPAACPRTMEALAVPGIDVQRWAKDWNGTQDFLPPEDYRFLAVATLSTHDTTNWNAWWEEESTREEKEKFWKRVGLNGPARESADPEVTGAALRFILRTKSIFSIQLIFDWLSLAGSSGKKEIVASAGSGPAMTGSILTGDQSRFRINKPGTVSDENWSLLLPISLEELLNHEVCAKIRNLVSGSGRI
ncbi:MAG: 4-alpha-glucanotransferase [Candidatus Omnitrophota bacterium]